MIHHIVEIAYTGDITDQNVLHQVALAAGLELIHRIYKVNGVVLQQFRPDKPSKAQADIREKRENWLERQLYFWLDGQQELLLGKRGRWDVQFKCVEMPDAVYIFQRQPAR